jgi:hypothetical protein
VSAQAGAAEGTRERVSLREELGAGAPPEFTIAVPRGWERVPVDEGGRTQLEQRLSSRMMQVGRLDLMIELRRMLRENLSVMAEHGAVALFMPLDPDGLGQTGAPTSITAYLRKGEPGAELDDYARQVIQRFGAAPLYDDLRTLRFETESTRDVDGTPVVLSTTHYLTPMPGSRRRRAVELLATYGRPESMPRDDERVVGLHVLFDVCASSLRWTAGRA